MSLQTAVRETSAFPMCGPSAIAPIKTAARLEPRALQAFARSRRLKKHDRWGAARLELDLARQGLPAIDDRIAIEIGRLEMKRARPNNALTHFSDALSTPSDSVRVRAARMMVEAMIAQDAQDAGAVLEQLLWDYPTLPEAAELRLAWAQSLERQSLLDEAIAEYRQLLILAPVTSIAASAEERLAALGAVATLDLQGRVDRAIQLMERGPLQAAREEIRELLDETELDSTQRARVHELAGWLARAEGRWNEAYQHYARAAAQDANSRSRYLEARAADAKSVLEARDAAAAKRLFVELKDGKALRRHRARKLVRMARISAAAGLQTETNQALEALLGRRNVPASARVEAATATMGSADPKLLIRLLAPVAKGGDRRALAAAYHLGRVHEREGHVEQAKRLFSQVVEESTALHRSYYALWAKVALRRLVGDPLGEVAEGFADNIGRSAPQKPKLQGHELAQTLEPLASRFADVYPWFARAHTLLKVDRFEAASEELFEGYLAWRQARGRGAARAGLDSVARGVNRTTSQLTGDIRQQRLALNEYDRDLLAQVALSLGDFGTAAGFRGSDYVETRPRAYEAEVMVAANRYGLDPNLLLAVMRVESVYQKRIVSYAGAIGLTQIMPRTGHMIAHALGREDFTPAELLNPKTNLEFAAWYLASLIRRFDGRLPLAIAAYNGGPHNVRRWMQEHRSDLPLDALLEEIPFTQTHRYVRRVLVHYEAYRAQVGLDMQMLSTELPSARIDSLAF